MTIKNKFAITMGFPNGTPLANPLRKFAIANNGLANGTQKRKPHCYITFLTSITFDSLSRKIKNPCLVINKIYSKRMSKMTHIKNMLKYLLITVMALSLLAVSCTKDKNNPTNPNPPVTDGGSGSGSSGGSETGGSSGTRTLSYYACNLWYIKRQLELGNNLLRLS